MPLLIALLATLPIPSASLAKLARERAAFDERVTDSKFSSHFAEAGGFERIASMPGSQASFAYYPKGISSERFVVFTVGGGGGFLMHQRLFGKVAKTDWYVDLEGDRPAKPKSGTLALMLWRNGFRIKARRLTRAQRASLYAVREYAGYGQEPIAENLWVLYVRKDGSSPGSDVYSPSPKDAKPGLLPITASEARALGLGTFRWYGSGKFDVRFEPPRKMPE